MSVEQNKAIVRRFVEECINNMNWSLWDELVAEDVDFDPPPGLPRNREGWKQNRQMLHAGFPDAHWTLEDVFAGDDKVACRVVLDATHQGDLFGIPATGRPVQVTGIALLQLQDGKIVKQRINNDDLGMMIQLGVVSMPQPAQK